ncbi:MAG: hypothetical protein KDD43_00385, partial [Bdellovibrionales bacterium]|nr:hypothetical protein [Bdellovibrionales bacterium]
RKMMRCRKWGICLVVGILAMAGGFGAQGSINREANRWDESFIQRTCGLETEEDCGRDGRLLAVRELPRELQEQPLINDWCGPGADKSNCNIDLEIVLNRDGCIESGANPQYCDLFLSEFQQIQLAAVNQWNCEQMGYSSQTCAIFRQLLLQM